VSAADLENPRLEFDVVMVGELPDAPAADRPSIVSLFRPTGRTRKLFDAPCCSPPRSPPDRSA
jgi:hypothetical protein